MYEEIEKEILRVVPEFGERYQDILKDYGNELKHVIVGDFSDFFIESFKKCDMSIVFRTIELIEELFIIGDKKINDLFITSFLENLYNSKDDFKKIKKLLKKKSFEAMNEIEKYSCI